MGNKSAYLSFLAERKAIIGVGKRLWKRGFVSSNDGNISVRLPGGLILCTPTGVSKGTMKPRDLAVLTLDGEIVELGARKGPSSEVKMHLGVYKEDPTVNAVVHAHPPRATLFAILGEPLSGLLLPEVVLTMPEVLVAPYATPSTDAVAESIIPLVKEQRVCLLEQHGTLSWADSLESAYLATEKLESLAALVYHLRLLGEDRQLSEDKIAALKREFDMSN